MTRPPRSDRAGNPDLAAGLPSSHRSGAVEWGALISEQAHSDYRRLFGRAQRRRRAMRALWSAIERAVRFDVCCVLKARYDGRCYPAGACASSEPAHCCTHSVAL